jgi:hypothetical protein
MHEIEKRGGESVTTVDNVIQIDYFNNVKNDLNYQAATNKFWNFKIMSSAANLTTLFCAVGQFYLMAKKANFTF